MINDYRVLESSYDELFGPFNLSNESNKILKIISNNISNNAYKTKLQSKPEGGSYILYFDLINYYIDTNTETTGYDIIETSISNFKNDIITHINSVKNDESNNKKQINSVKLELFESIYDDIAAFYNFKSNDKSYVGADPTSKTNKIKELLKFKDVNIPYYSYLAKYYYEAQNISKDAKLYNHIYINKLNEENINTKINELYKYIQIRYKSFDEYRKKIKQEPHEPFKKDDTKYTDASFKELLKTYDNTSTDFTYGNHIAQLIYVIFNYNNYIIQNISNDVKDVAGNESYGLYKEDLKKFFNTDTHKTNIDGIDDDDWEALYYYGLYYKTCKLLHLISDVKTTSAYSIINYFHHHPDVGNSGTDEEIELKTKLITYVNNTHGGDFKKAFDNFDKDEDNSLNTGELIDALDIINVDRFNLFTRNLWVNGIMDKMDVDEDSMLTFPELVGDFLSNIDTTCYDNLDENNCNLDTYTVNFINIFISLSADRFDKYPVGLFGRFTAMSSDLTTVYNWDWDFDIIYKILIENGFKQDTILDPNGDNFEYYEFNDALYLYLSGLSKQDVIKILNKYYEIIGGIYLGIIYNSDDPIYKFNTTVENFEEVTNEDCRGAMGSKELSCQITDMNFMLAAANPNKNKNKIGIIVGSVVGGIILIICLVLILRKRKQSSHKTTTKNSNTTKNRKRNKKK